jgi:NADH-quinone oxidoreductase subunit M
MTALLLILVPLIGGLVTFFLKQESQAKLWSFVVSLVTLAAMSVNLLMHDEAGRSFTANGYTIRSSFAFNGWCKCIACSLTGTLLSIILVLPKSSYTSPNNFYGLMLLAQAGITGIFLAADGHEFVYFFWELALIPVYFLCSKWGGESELQLHLNSSFIHSSVHVDAGWFVVYVLSNC